MSHMIQIRNVPAEVHRALKARAAMAGTSMSEMILEEMKLLVALPTEDDLREQLAKAEPFAMKTSSVKIIRQDRDAA